MSDGNGGNGELKPEEKKGQIGTPNLGQAQSPNLGQAGSSGMNPPNEQKKLESEMKKEAPSKDFKIAEIWIREGQVMLDASPEFWSDKLRARGLLKYCDDIVKDFQPQKPRIITGQQHSMMNFARNMFKRKR